MDSKHPHNCTVCGLPTIVGVMYSCTHCDDFHVCSEDYETNPKVANHNPDHSFMKIPTIYAPLNEIIWDLDAVSLENFCYTENSYRVWNLFRSSGCCAEALRNNVVTCAILRAPSTSNLLRSDLKLCNSPPSPSRISKEPSIVHPERSSTDPPLFTELDMVQRKGGKGLFVWHQCDVEATER